MALPTVTINNSTGSNTAASGAGPATAVTGSAATLTSGSSSVAISDAVDISGVAVDGSAVLYANTSSGSKFFKITAISGSSGAWTVTIDPKPSVTSTGVSWAIGGKRKDFETTNSHTKQLFNDDWRAGWTVVIEETGTDYVVTSAITVSTNSSSSTAATPIVVKSNSATMPRITCATNSVSIWDCSAAFNHLQFRRLRMSHTAGTRGVCFIRTSGFTGFVFQVIDCELDGFSSGFSAVTNSASVQLLFTTIKNCTGSGYAANGILTAHFSSFLDNGAHGAFITDQTSSSHTFIGCIFAGNVSCGVTYTTAAVHRSHTLYDNLFVNNGSHGYACDATTSVTLIAHNNVFWGNGGYGISLATATNQSIRLNDFNAYGDNTSGSRNNLAAGTNDITLTADPFEDAANNDFNINDAAGGGALIRAASFSMAA